MKKIETVIRPEQFLDLRNMLEEIGISGLTVTEAAGCGKQEGKQGVFRGSRYEIKLFPKVRVEMVVEDHLTDQIIDVIVQTCGTGTVGDGKIFIIPIEDAIRIRTGETGLNAII